MKKNPFCLPPRISGKQNEHTCICVHLQATFFFLGCGHQHLIVNAIHNNIASYYCFKNDEAKSGEAYYSECDLVVPGVASAFG